MTTVTVSVGRERLPPPRRSSNSLEENRLASNWACRRRRFPAVINAHNQTDPPRLSLALPASLLSAIRRLVLKKLQRALARSAIRHPRARIKEIALKNTRSPGRASRLLSVRPCPQAPRVILGIGRALCAAFRARKRFVIHASVVCVGGVCARAPRGSLFTRRPRRALCSPHDLARQCHPTRCSRIQIVTASRNPPSSPRAPVDEQWPPHYASRFQRPPPRCL